MICLEDEFKIVVSDNNDTSIVTTGADESIDSEKISKLENKILLGALKNYQTFYKKGLSSNFLGSQDLSNQNLSINFINSLADNPQNNIQTIKQINSLAKQFVNRDDVIGKVYESIQNYTNTDYTIDYPQGNETDNEQLKQIQDVINKFNEAVNLKKVIRNGIPMSYLEGNYIVYLRNDSKGNYVIDKYPLGVCEISEYSYNGLPLVVFNIDELKRKLKPSNKKSKNGKSLFFQNASEIVKNNYPPEVVKAFNNKEKWTILNPERVGIVRINNLDGLYGLTPIFKALKPALMLETIEKADENTIKAKAKKIIHQGLRKELGGNDGNRKAFAEAAHAHQELTNAFKQDTVLYTSQHWVEFVKYVEPNVQTTDEKTLNFYRSKEFTALGVSFLDSYNSNISASNISVEALMKMINSIGEQFENIINRFYKVVLEENNFDEQISPVIKILDSEVMNFEMRKSLAEFMYTKLNCSIKKAYEIMGVASAENELNQRDLENKSGWNEVFSPHSSFYTQSKSENIGRPEKEETKRQTYDKERYKGGK